MKSEGATAWKTPRKFYPKVWNGERTDLPHSLSHCPYHGQLCSRSCKLRRILNQKPKAKTRSKQKKEPIPRIQVSMSEILQEEC